MIWLDWLILGIVTYNLVTGLMSGLLRSLINLAALIAAYLLTPLLKGMLVAILQLTLMLPDYLALPLGTSLTWMLIYLVISAVGLTLVKMLHKTPLKLVDRLGGAAFGLLISALLILLPLAAIRSLPFLQKVPPLQNTLKSSSLVPILEPAVAFVQTTAGPAVVNYWLKQQEQGEMRQSMPSPTPPPAGKPAAPATPRPPLKP